MILRLLKKYKNVNAMKNTSYIPIHLNQCVFIVIANEINELIILVQIILFF